MRKHRNKPTPNAHYHEEVTYDSKRENWSGLTSLLLIPLFIMLVGWGVVSTFRLPVRNDVGGPGPGQNNSGIGIGGGPGTSVTPYKVPTISISPIPTEDDLFFIQ